MAVAVARARLWVILAACLTARGVQALIRRKGRRRGLLGLRGEVRGTYRRQDHQLVADASVIGDIGGEGGPRLHCHGACLERCHPEATCSDVLAGVPTDLEVL